MNIRTRLFIVLAIHVALASFVPTTEAAGGGRSIVRNDAPHRRRFGTRRATVDEDRTTRRPSFVVVADAAEQSSSSPLSAEVADAFTHDESQSRSSAAEPMMEVYHPRRIVADGARAAAVAFVSAAAIGGARHAMEMIVA
jgi:hypothetical protein